MTSAAPDVLIDPSGELEPSERQRAVRAPAGAVRSAWGRLRSSTPLLLAGPLAADAALDHVHDDPRANRLLCAWWLILMRWVAVTVGAAAVYIAVEVAGVLPGVTEPYLGAMLALLAIFNIGYTVYLRRQEATTAFLVVQVYADLVFLVILLHFSGGIENPLAPLFLLHVIIAGILLGRLHTFLVAATASALFALLAWGECVEVLPHYTLTIFPHEHAGGLEIHAAEDRLYAASLAGLQTLILMLVAWFTTTLVERIHRDGQRLETLADRALAQTLERALDTTGTALCLSDRELRPYWSNERWATWQTQAPELRGAIAPAESPAASTLQDGVIRQAEIRSRDGTNGGSGDGAAGRVFHLTSAPLRDRDGHVSQVVTMARDVTAHYLAQAHAVRAERLAAVGELAGQVAHEVNNPIAIISAKARLLLRSGTAAMPPRVSEELTKIAELSDRVARIAQGLLSYCRPAPGVRVPLDVSGPLRRALTFVETRAAGAGVRIHDTLGGSLPPVQANAAELEQVFLNLFLNALDAMPDGGALSVSARRVSAPAGDGRALLAVEVADTGTGMPAELCQRVFEPFMTTKGEKGSGLGLSICQGLMRSHGGEITIASEPGRGTRVTLTLPIAVPRLAPPELVGADA